MQTILQPTNSVCPLCHQVVQSEFYFCPNCGKNLKEKPPSTTAFARLSLYAASVIVPMTLFLAARLWPIKRYLRSSDPVAHRVGIIALTLATLSAIFVVVTAYEFTVSILPLIKDSLGIINPALLGL